MVNTTIETSNQKCRNKICKKNRLENRDYCAKHQEEFDSPMEVEDVDTVILQTLKRKRGQVTRKHQEVKSYEEESEEEENIEKESVESYRNSLRSFFYLIQKIEKEKKWTKKHMDVLKQTPFYNFVNLLFKHKLAIEDITKNSKAIDAILSFFSTENNSFHFKDSIINLKEEDIAAIFGMPVQGKIVSTGAHVKQEDMSNECQNFKWKFFKDEKNIQKKDFENGLSIALEGEGQEDIEDSVRLLIMHLLSTYLLSNANSSLSWILLPLTYNFAKMKAVSWPKTINLHLTEQIRKNKKCPRKIHACVTILLYWFSDFSNSITSKQNYQKNMPTAGKWNLQNVTPKAVFGFSPKKMIEKTDQEKPTRCTRVQTKKQKTEENTINKMRAEIERLKSINAEQAKEIKSLKAINKAQADEINNLKAKNEEEADEEDDSDEDIAAENSESDNDEKSESSDGGESESDDGDDGDDEDKSDDGDDGDEGDEDKRDDGDDGYEGDEDKRDDGDDGDDGDEDKRDDGDDGNEDKNNDADETDDDDGEKGAIEKSDADGDKNVSDADGKKNINDEDGGQNKNDNDDEQEFRDDDGGGDKMKVDDGLLNLNNDDGEEIHNEDGSEKLNADSGEEKLNDDDNGLEKIDNDNGGEKIDDDDAKNTNKNEDQIKDDEDRQGSQDGTSLKVICN